MFLTILKRINNYEFVIPSCEYIYPTNNRQGKKICFSLIPNFIFFRHSTRYLRIQFTNFCGIIITRVGLARITNPRQLSTIHHVAEIIGTDCKSVAATDLFNFYRENNNRNTKFEKSLLNGKNCMVMQ